MIEYTSEFARQRLEFWKRKLYESTQTTEDEVDVLIGEGKHWPEDYKKTAHNTIKSSPLGKKDWYSDTERDKDIDKLVELFKPLSHRSANLGFFATLVRWLIEYGGVNQARHTEFFQSKVQSILRYLRIFLNDDQLLQRHRDEVKKNMTLSQFEEFMKSIDDQTRADAEVEFEVEDKGYKIIPILTYEDLNRQFGGTRTGFQGRSSWCHTNARNEYAQWINEYKNFFFVLARDGWKDLKPADLDGINPYDKYGTSLMAILVSRDGELLRCTLRWNHLRDPAKVKRGRTVDQAFISFAELSKVTGLDVQQEVQSMLPGLIQKSKKLPNGRLVYSGPEGQCYATYQLLWYDKDYNIIGAPHEVNGDFDCSNTELLVLRGCPEVVGGSFNCSFTRIISLEGCPQEVGDDFYCFDTYIESLEHCPKTIPGSFICSNNYLTSLEHCPQAIGYDFKCSGNGLQSLQFGPKKVGHHYDCSNNQLGSLVGSPSKINGSFCCSDAGLTSLKGAPSYVEEDFYCGFNEILNLEGGPNTVGGDLDLTNSHIKSLEGAPEIVGGSLILSSSMIDTLAGAPRVVGKDIVVDHTAITRQEKARYEDWLDTDPAVNYMG